ncbi:hypothetical protein [Sorangium sp. So ce426]|uniref:hypothetical protein n=1 Tax=Sorangium sp. So ce426 TaxID=3133312 RepID=UPI003F5CBA87
MPGAEACVDARALALAGERRARAPRCVAVGLGITVPTVHTVHFYTDAAGARHGTFQGPPVSAIVGLGLGLALP